MFEKRAATIQSGLFNGLLFLKLLASVEQGFCDETCQSKIPKKIWQTYKTNDLPIQAQNAQASWIQKNPEYEYVLWDDVEIENYILKEWNSDTYRFFKALPLGVMKADLWRYLIIKTEGGIYSDIDSKCCLPIDKWTLEVGDAAQNVLLLGLEHDRHFCQWTIAATANHPALEYACSYLVKNWLHIGIDTTSSHFVGNITGPAIWTESIVTYLGEDPGAFAGEIFRKYKSDKQYRQKVNDLGIYIFPKEFYAGLASENLYGSQNFGDGYIRWLEEMETLISNTVLEDFFHGTSTEFSSFRYAVDLMEKRGVKTIVEIGSTGRILDGCNCNGYFKEIFARWAFLKKANIYSAHTVPQVFEKARDDFFSYERSISFVHSDSGSFYKNFHGSIDFLYLNSPINYLKEIIIAYTYLHDNSIIFIDDCNLKNGRKRQVAIDFLLKHDWKIEIRDRQIVFTRKN